MKQHLMILVLVAFGAAGCATHVFDKQQNWPGGGSHVVDQQFGNGSSVHIERTESKLPLFGAGVDGLNGLVGGGVYMTPNLTNQIIAPNGLAAAEQISGGTIHVAGTPVPVVQPPPSIPATAGDATRDEDLAVLAEKLLRQQKEIDELKGSKVKK